MDENTLIQIARTIPTWRVAVDVNEKSGKFRLCLWHHPHKVVGLWRDTIGEATEAALEKIVAHPGMMADFREFAGLRPILDHHRDTVDLSGNAP